MTSALFFIRVALADCLIIDIRIEMYANIIVSAVRRCVCM